MVIKENNNILPIPMTLSRRLIHNLRLKSGVLYKRIFKLQITNINTMRHLIIIILLCLWSIYSIAQTNPVLTIDNCYAIAQQNYPLIKQRELIAKSTDFSLENASKAYYPQLSFNGQATYQSAVTEVPIKLPNQTIPTISKNQYKMYADLNQVLYDGGNIKTQKEMLVANSEIEKQKTEIELYKLKDRINQLFFGVLLVNEQIKQTELLQKDIQSGITKTNAAIANGIALKNGGDVLQAEYLKSTQRMVELKAAKNAYLDMLGLFLSQTLNENTQLVKPVAPALATTINRPELLLYYNQNKLIDAQSKMISVKTMPKVNLFVQAGFGRPALNMLDNSFTGYYIGGVRFSWSLSGLYTAKKEREILGFNYSLIEIQKETFLFNTNLALKQQSAEVSKMEELIKSDSEIISLRTKIKNNSMVQLENGIITSNDYLRELNAEDQAKQNQSFHVIQLLMAQYNQQTTSGN